MRPRLSQRLWEAAPIVDLLWHDKDQATPCSWVEGALREPDPAFVRASHKRGGSTAARALSAQSGSRRLRAGPAGSARRWGAVGFI